MKIIATYLPQFHRIPENDEWWGKGFTEWTNVKKSIPLFEKHYQPRIPLEDNYYDLSDGVEIDKQMEMANEYGVNCFAIYHYWFCGKQLLEKPVEFLLNQTKTPIEYCFCWANESWSRTWNGDSHKKDILIEQQYGDIDDWKKHYLYLRRFFMHSGYLKEGKKPVFIIYNAGDLKNQQLMFKYWNNLAEEDGFDGIKIIITRRENNIKCFPVYGDEVVDFEPFTTLHNMNENDKNAMSKLYVTNENEYKVIDYKVFCEKMVARRHLFKKSNYGLFIGWDNSPRRGKNTKLIFDNNSPEVFEWVFAKQYKKSIEENNQYLYINAWNEWGEGTYLEPDKKYKFGYLEAIRSIIKDGNRR